jgi:hypothetical protein
LVEVVERIERDANQSLLYHYVIHDFLVTPLGGTLAAGSDASQARFFDPAALATLPLTRGLVDVIARAREQVKARSRREC